MLNFWETFDLLTELYESVDKVEHTTIFPALPPDLSKVRSISTDIRDIRGELETNSCLEYSPDNKLSPILTRVQVRTLIYTSIEDKEYFLGKRGYYGKIYLPGGGYDQVKDAGDPRNTARREAWEEFNFELTDVKNPQLYSWSCRNDSFVQQHVAAEEDRWTGYLTILITAKYAGNSNNDNPEELGEWKWLPIKLLETNAFYKQGLQSMSLLEAVRPDKEGNPDLGEVSYLCDSLQTLHIILSTMEIQKTYVKEVRVKIPKTEKRAGRPKAGESNIKQYSLSTSTNLTGHAYRRPDRWGFGVILDGAKLSKYYDLEPYNHAQHVLKNQYLTKIVKLKDGRVIICISNYGNREITDDNSTMGNYLYEYIADYIEKNKANLPPVRTLNDYAISNDSWGRANPFKGDTRFDSIKPSEVAGMYAFMSESPSKNALPLKTLPLFDLIVECLMIYSNFNEEELRIWIEDNLLNFIQIPKDTLVGVILPKFFKDDYDLESPTNVHIAWIKQFVKDRNLRVIWHDNMSNTYAQELTSGQVETAKKDFDDLMAKLQPEAIVAKVKDLSNKVPLAQLRQIVPIEQVATAVVKNAINQKMQDLTADNFQEKYDEAFTLAVEDGLKCKIRFKKSDVETSIKNLFDYYCPEQPKN